MTARVDIRHGERGLSLVELVVAMVIMMILMGMVSMALSDGMSSRDSVAGDSKISETADRTMDQLSSDLRTTTNPGRTEATDSELLLGLSEGVDISDIRTAGPYVLELRSEVNGGHAGAECVRYQVDAQGSLWRTVFSDYLRCAVGPALPQIASERLLPGLGAVGVNASPDLSTISNGAVFQPTQQIPTSSVTFQYELAVPDVVAGSNSCDRQRVGEITTAKQRAEIIGVTVRLSPALQTRTDVSTTVFTDTISVRSRAGANYRRAIGCASGVRATADQA